MPEEPKEIALERMYCLRIGDLTVALVEAEAEELFKLLHAEFGEKAQIGFPVPHPLFDRITNPVRGPGIADRLRPPYEVGPYNPFDGPTCSIPIRPTAEGLDRLAADLGLTPVTAPVSETPLLRHEGMSFPEPGPTLNDDIESMIANQSPDAGKMVDDADEQEEEFLSRLPKIAVAPDVADAPSTVNGIPVSELTLPPVTKFEPTSTCCYDWATCDCGDLSHCKSVHAIPSSTPEPPAEPETVVEAPATSSDRQVAQTWQDRLLELWAKYADKTIQDRMKLIYTSTRSSKFAELRAMDTAGIRETLRAFGVEVPDPMTPQERAAIARAKRFANAANRLEPPKVDEPKPEPTKLTPSGLVDRVPVPPLELGWQDQLALTFDVLDAGETPTTFSSYYTAKCGTEELAAYVGEVATLRDDYWALMPYERREFKESLSAKWRKVAA